MLEPFCVLLCKYFQTYLRSYLQIWGVFVLIKSDEFQISDFYLNERDVRRWTSIVFQIRTPVPEAVSDEGFGPLFGL